MSLDGLVVLVTGANRGIGLQLCKEFIIQGCTVFGTVHPSTRQANDSSIQDLEATGAGILELDVTVEESIAKAAAEWGEKPLDILVNNAGSPPPPRTWDEVTADILVEKFRVNAVGPFLVSKEFLPALEKSENPKVINIASNSGQIDANNNGKYLAYKVSKTALNQITKSLAMQMQMQGRKVTFNGIHPGYIPTRLTGFLGPDNLIEQVERIVSVIATLGPTDTGRFLDSFGNDMEF